jgi:UDP-2,3-diacylglucosamine pyrophosphatase LpxH
MRSLSGVSALLEAVADGSSEGLRANLVTQSLLSLERERLHMEKAAIFVSDLHLGKGDELEDFVPENEGAFLDFLKSQSDSFANQKVDLVLLGDLLDVWQVATESEKHAAQSHSVDISVKLDMDAKRVKEIISVHPKSFEALRSFLNSGPDLRRVICIPGNHDHSLVHPTVQAPVVEAITQGDNALAQRVVFQNYYEDPELGIYAEHGNQLDEDNDYDNFDLFGGEAPGFYFVRLFWNRLEVLHPNLDNWMNSFSAIWKQKLWYLLGPAYRLFRQYLSDERPFKRIQVASFPSVFFEGRVVGVPSRGENLKEFPDLLFTEKTDPKRVFSTDNQVETRLRNLYHQPENKEFKDTVDEILDQKFRGNPPRVPVGPDNTAQLEFLLKDPYISAIKGMFDTQNGTPHARPLKGGVLKPDTHKFVLIGHTHDEKREIFDDLKVTYFNTGSWSVHRDENGNNASRLCYVIIRKSAQGSVSAEQRLWSRS